MRPAARTLNYFRDYGYSIGMVERWVGGYRHDYLGVVDAFAFKPGKEKIIAIQIFGSDWSEHRRKVIDDQHEGAKELLSNKNFEFIFIGWRKLKLKRGGKAVRWTPRFGKVTLSKKKKKLKLQEVKTIW